MSPLVLVLACFFGSLACCWLAWCLCVAATDRPEHIDKDYDEVHFL